MMSFTLEDWLNSFKEASESGYLHKLEFRFSLKFFLKGAFRTWLRILLKGLIAKSDYY